MEGLNKRQIEFIRLLLQSAQYKPILYYSDKLKVSDKTLKEDLKKIRKYLSQYEIQIFAKPGRGILLDQDAKNSHYFLNSLREKKEEVPHDSSEARRATILKKLLVYSNGTTSIHKLSEEFYVSRASIVNDMKYIQHWLADFGLTLEKTKEGTRVNGKERDIRKAIAALIDGYQKKEWNQMPVNSLYELTKLDKTTLNGLLELFDIEDILYVESLILDMERKNEIVLGQLYYVNLLTHILICIKRVQEGSQIEEARANQFIRTDTLNQYQNALSLGAEINQHFNITIGENETYYIYQYLISSGLDGQLTRSYEPDKDKADYEEISLELIQYISDVLRIDYSIETELLNGLLLHIRPMLRRLQYNIQISNPLLEEMKQWYPQMLGICRIILGLLARRFSLPAISLDETAYIATYFQTMTFKLTRPKNILIVCHSGYGTSQLLAAKIQYEFSSLNIVDVISSRELETTEIDMVDYIISTVPIQNSKVPHIVISALLTEQDIETIRQNLHLNQHHKLNSGYLNLAPRLSKEKIHIGAVTDAPPFGSQKDVKYHLHTADLCPGLGVAFYITGNEKSKNAGEGENIIIDVCYSVASKLTLYIYTPENHIFKGILSELYFLSTSAKDMQRLLECTNADDILSFFSK